METILKEILADSLFQEGVAWKKRNFNKNDFIIKQGEKGNLLFYVEEGVLRVTGSQQATGENAGHFTNANDNNGFFCDK